MTHQRMADESYSEYLYMTLSSINMVYNDAG